LVRSLAEAASIPLTLALSIVAAPIGYLDTQIYSLATDPVDHAMDTLAQIPGIEVGVRVLDHALGHEVPWGRRGKGLFSLGTLHESVGRTSARGFLSRAAPEVFGLESIRVVPGEDCMLPSCRTTFALDASPVIRESGLGFDLERPLADFTIGWIDLIGAHGDYLGPGPVRVIIATLGQP
jgi:hypothetical protein